MSRNKLIELPYTTREERIQALIELKERCARAGMTATGRAATEAAAIELRCLQQIAAEMKAEENESLIQRAESLTTTLESGIARPSLAPKTKPSKA